MKYLLGTVLLEPNRWKNRNQPVLRVAEWLPRIAEAGFEGIELWENHWHCASDSERDAIKTSPVPIAGFNTYPRFDDPAAETEVNKALAVCEALGARYLKFNVGHQAPQSLDEANARLKAIASRLPEATELRCECHAGTWLETPEAVSNFIESSPEPPPFVGILHAFAMPIPELIRWLSIPRFNVKEIHVQCIDENGKWVGIARYPNRSCETLRVLSDHGFDGDFTLEFTEGTAAQGNDPEVLWKNALEDFAFLRTEASHLFS
jgi:sugar phosphate isomerase/epimerase